MGRAKPEYETTIHYLTVNTDTARTQQVTRDSCILDQRRLIKDRRNGHVLLREQFDFRKAFGKLTLFHPITRRTMRSRSRFVPMETRNDLLGQLDLDIPGIGSPLDISTKLIEFTLRPEAEQLEVPPHERIRDRDQLAIHDAWCFLDPDVIAKGLGHLLHAIQPLKQRHGHYALRGLTVRPLKLAPHKQVEFLVSPSELYVSLQRNRVIPLDERIEELMDGYRLVRGVALTEVITLKHTSDSILRS